MIMVSPLTTLFLLLRRCTGVLMLTMTIAGWSWSAWAEQTDGDYSAAVAQIVAQGGAALEGYRPEDGISVGAVFSNLYFDAFEGSGMEMAIAREDEVSKVELESRFSNVIGACMRSAPREEVMAYWQDLLIGLNAAAEHLKKAKPKKRSWPW
jgi:high-affinity iron transporter